ncbi:hypothetical protein PQ469_28130 [Mucilaginibacter sp. KACC 22773]|jgi:hypothetical protein|uniref:hypothetical protein n=1 Tax=Mucilaginibacter sp. KACC 22773 TaxID=3025671 RepID=UPI0023664CE1|nr:hypothetical protein [Mucilaginibacter sp. KACC 22773]WDF77758.1 hypothetical protein PQ469_28130 [Mucilaginibacter sp. KACC 22773]
MKNYLFLFLLLIGKECDAQTVDSNTRPPFELKLFVNDSTFYNAPMNASQYVYNKKTIQVFPGESLLIEAELSGDSLVNLKVVPENIHKEKTIKISFSQSVEGRIHQQMILSVVNPFSKKLDYSAQINLLNQKKWVKTSIIPVLPGLVSYETWPDLITTIALYDFCLKSESPNSKK